jgi:hypothetical protein
MIQMKTEVRFDTLNFVIVGLVAVTMDLDMRTFVENSASRSIYLSIFALIQVILTAPRSIE